MLLLHFRLPAGSCSMREIFDEYCRDFERQRQEEASKQRPGARKVASTTNGQAADQALAAVGGGAAADAASSSSSGGVSRPDQASTDKQWAALEALLDKVCVGVNRQDTMLMAYRHATLAVQICSHAWG
jgi:hypothetical protein